MLNVPAWNCEQLNTASVKGLPLLTRLAGAERKLSVSAFYPRGRRLNPLLGFDKVRVAPIGLTLCAFVQSANWNQYWVSALRLAASTFRVKSTSAEVNASPESSGLPERLGLLKILKDSQTGTLWSGTPLIGTARVHSRTESSKGSPYPERECRHMQ